MTGEQTPIDYYVTSREKKIVASGALIFSGLTWKTIEALDG